MSNSMLVSERLNRCATAVALSVALLANGAIAEGKIEHLKSKRKDVAAGEQASQKLKCPDGMHVLSGGVYTSGPSLEDEVAGNAPFDGPDSDKRADDGWRGAINAGAEARTMRTYAICSNTLDVSYRESDFEFGLNLAGQRIQVNCPAGSKPVGGGLTVAGKNTTRPLVYSQLLLNPSASLWESGLRNSTAGPGNAVAHAICSDEPGLSLASGGGPISPQAQGSYAATCPAGTAVVGGGGSYGPGDDGSTSLELASLVPSDGDDADTKPNDAWTTWFNNEHGSSSVIGYVSAICVD